MSVGHYDQALLNKIKSWIGDTSLGISGPDDKTSLWMRIADESGKDRIELPLVSLMRGSDITINALNKKPMSFNGHKVRYSKGKIDQLNGIPITIPYQFDIYTRHRTENDNLVREFIFKFINNPKLEIEIPYKNTKIYHESNVWLTENIQDNSDIPEHLINGEFFRVTLGLVIKDAYLFDYRIRDTLKIMVEYDDQSDQTEMIYQDSK